MDDDDADDDDDDDDGGGGAEDRDGVDALDMNVDEDKAKATRASVVSIINYPCQPRLHIHILLTSPPGEVREVSAESAHADDDHDECSTAKA
jgi:hypothetical protein